MIRKGYQLQVTSWENDGDYENTIVIDGLQKDDVEFYLNFLKVFKELDLENRYDENITEEEVEQFREKISEIYEGNTPEKYKECFHDEDTIIETSQELLGGGGDGFTTRVYDSHKIYYFPENIRDITDQFTFIDD